MDKIKAFLRLLKDKLLAGWIRFRETLLGAGKKCLQLLRRFKERLKGLPPRTKKLLAFGVPLLLVAGLVVTVMFYYDQLRDPHKVLLEGDLEFGLDADVSIEFPKNVVNIALLGFDRDSFREKYAYLFLPDVIAVMSIDFEKDLVSFIRIPRDTYVTVYYTGIKDKINHSYYHGYHYGRGEDPDAEGLRFTLETVKSVIGGAPIHYYVSVCMDAVVQLVDSMGGVHYDVEERLYDRLGNVLLFEGPQLLSGLDFLTYVRHRDDETDQDLGRIERQMKLLRATFDYYREQDLLKNIPFTYKVYKDHVDTNLTYKQIAALALYGRDFAAGDETIRFFSFTGRNQMKDGLWYLTLDQAERIRIIKEVFGITAARWPTEVLTDTPPPAPASFTYTLQPADGGMAVLLSWLPGDQKKVHYELYRNDQLLVKTEDTTFLDTKVAPGQVYSYRLVVYHYRATGPAAIITVHIDHPEVEPAPDPQNGTEQPDPEPDSDLGPIPEPDPDNEEDNNN